LECVNLMLRACANGPGSDSHKVAREGVELLEKVQAKLKSAAADFQRFDGESLAGAISTGKTSDRLTRAATAVARAKQRLEQVSES
jgi:hypothetical protein